MSNSIPLHIERVSKHFGASVALDDVNLELPAGKLICFLGPSGCGKTTLLRIIAGLESTVPDARIRLGERELTRLPAHRRNIGMVFQSFALFPHLDVAENIAYGLRIRGADRRARRRHAERLLELVQLGGLGDRHVAQLSGGQRQRVAMARALALEPDLFLLDEPLSALDAKLREAMQVELRQLQQRLGITTIIVTHDQAEAMTMADVVVVMGDNRVQQSGPPLEVYQRPANRFVADFIGTNNLLPAERAGADALLVLGRRLPLRPPPEDGKAAGTGGGTVGDRDGLTVAIRPEDVQLRPEPQGPHAVEGEVAFVRNLGLLVETFVRVGEQRVVVVGAPPLAEGTRVWLELPAERCVVLTR